MSRVRQIKTNMDNKNAKNNEVLMLLKSIDPLLKLERCYGIFRFHIFDDHLGPINRMMKVYGICIMFAFTIPYCVLCFYSYSKIENFDTVAIVDALENFPPLIMALQYFIFIIISLQLHDKNILLIKKLAQVDRILNVSMKKDFFENFHKDVQILLFLFLISYTFSLIPDFFDIFNERNYYQIISVGIDFPLHLESLSFYIFIKILTVRLNILNNHLIDLIKLKNQKNASPFIDINISNENLNYTSNDSRASHRNNKTIRLGEAYKIIGEANYLINDIFEFQNFMSLVSTFVYIIITLWSSIYFYRTLKQLNLLLAFTVQCVYEIFIISLMSYICDVMSSERNTTKILVNELIVDYNLPKAIRIQAKTFMELIEVWPLKIFAYDMFPIDIKLILKFVSVSTTFLIVIIQISHFI
ncbi:uncharacterized protein LOC113402524 [Vanessa tameamea]|uniref:Gustatory receptor n=1 Tax=Vanessa tameamea TaxID=334116 RepID=A0A8B8IS97_VANTA|nr:uncharacterized protein LOC113402524 [Vanessa tameamea]